MWNGFSLVAIFLIIVSSASLSLSQINASYVLGSSNLNTKGTIPSPTGVYISPLSGKVFVSNEVQIYRFPNSALATDGASPEVVLGTPYACCNGGLTNLGYITIDESDSLWGADISRDRVFKAELISSTYDLSFSLVLGQSSFTYCNSVGNRLDQMDAPQHALVDSTRDDLWVADFMNSRVLRFGSASSLTTGASATAFLGTGLGGSSAADIRTPISLALDPQGGLYVADFGNYRVVRFDNAHYLESGAEASFVLGQPNLNSSHYSGLSQSSFYNPYFIFLFDDVLYVSDYYDYRVMIFSDVSTLQNGANATSLLGQSDFNAVDVSFLTPYSIWFPLEIYCDGKSLLVPSHNEYRVLRYDMPLPPLFPSPSPSSSLSPSLSSFI